MRYFIVGFKGSGKTTIGRQLALKLNMEFIDLDEYIEKNYGKTVTEIYSLEGEDGFRNKEWMTLKNVIKVDNIVVATGGGAPCNCDNMNLMEHHGEVIYLDVDTDTIFERLKPIAAERPVLKNKTNDELRLYIKQQKSICESQYQRAKYRISNKNISVDNIYNIITKNKN